MLTQVHRPGGQNPREHENSQRSADSAVRSSPEIQDVPSAATVRSGGALKSASVKDWRSTAQSTVPAKFKLFHSSRRVLLVSGVI